MGFFKKLFRRKNKKKGSRRDNGAFLQSQPDNVHHNHGNMIRKPAFNKNPPAAYDSFKSPQLNSADSRSRTSGMKGNNNRASHDSSYGSSFDSREESYHRPGGSGSRQSQADHFGYAEFQADFTEFNNENNGNYANAQSPMNIHGRSPHGRSQAGNSHNNNALDYDQLQRLEKDQASQGNNNKYGHPPSKKLQLTRLPNGELVAMGATNSKGAASPYSPSSDFDLSTDAEDNEYNQIRTYDGNGNLKPMLGSPGSHSDEDPDLYGRKNKMHMSNSESDHGSFRDGSQTNRSRHYFSDSERESHGEHTPSSRASMGNGEERSPNNNLSPQAASKFTFDTEFTDPAMSKSKDSAEHQKQDGKSPEAVSPEARSGDGPSPRSIAIQQAQKMRIQGNFSDDNYADSTDSENGKKNVPNSSPPKDTISPTNPQRSDGIIENFVDFDNNAFESRPSSGYSKSVAGVLSPVSNLIAQAEERRRRKGASSNSISSAPNMNDPRRQVPRPVGSTSAAAREKLQRRRKEKKEWLKSNGGGSDDDSDNGKDNESWLHNEVSSALGPQGIQADLESLGERSYRSRNSVSNRSHKSHRSHRSTSRRNRGSDASVGSRHSRASKSSRASRYSIKSTKSHLSAMSVESRSVANDLIRLEMQLAMFSNKSGENGIKKDLEIEAKKKGITGLTVNRHNSSGSVGGSSIGARSRPSSHSNSNPRARPVISKRLKCTVKAPPGKLGIILANKNDGKGTVVSGVRTTSILADKVSPGDRIIAIDGEDVSRMTVTEITSIMSRKSDYDRMLTVLSSN